MNTKTDQFHKGEIHLQEQVGVRAEVERAARIMMRDTMSDQHREFFEKLEYILVGTVDTVGRPHASLLTGPLGFVSSPDPKTLVITAQHSTNTTAFNALSVGSAIGVLGIDLAVFRRNRMHGRIIAHNEDKITIQVTQSYGNCPKYINRREISDRMPPKDVDTIVDTALAMEDRGLLNGADTFFIASYVQDGSGNSYEGADVNHRGGAPGFVHVENDTTLLIPDYRGNNLFNTFGNLVVNPTTGLLFLDFETGDQLHMIGHTELIVNDPEISLFPDALRLLKITIEEITRLKAGASLRWSLLETSRFNPLIRPK